MDEARHISYRVKAAELRAVAAAATNFILRDDLLQTAILFDRLADFSDQNPTLSFKLSESEQAARPTLPFPRPAVSSS